ncbi:hypothetical protein H0R92_13655 [Treponema sp. OMZ 840]|uniref:hypothetical protein n=1 Tax=Treponema sp. OMZ 840 TaxID=244313 RepID=UPI003D9360DB
MKRRLKMYVKRKLKNTYTNFTVGEFLPMQKLGKHPLSTESGATHTELALRMHADQRYSESMDSIIGGSAILQKDIDAYKSGDMMTMLDHVAGNYDWSKDYWLLTHGGQLVNDGQGWLRDVDGKYISIDGTRTDRPIEGETLGGSGIETGLLNLLGGTSGKAYAAFTPEEKAVAQQLMSKAEMQMDKNGYWYALDENERDTNKGKRLNMYDFMSTAGIATPDVIFDTYYNNTVDSQLAKAWGVDLGFERNHAVPEVLAGRYSNLILKHVGEVNNATGLKNKYKFTAYGKDTEVELFKIDKNNPFLDDVLKQTNPNLNSVINKSGCNFMTTIAFPQLLTGNILNATQIQSIWDSSTTKKIKWWKTGEMLPLVDSDDSYVRQPDYITNMVFERMNINNLKLQFGGNSNNPIIGYKVKVPFEITKEHWLLSDRYFNYTYNPGSTTDKLLDYNSVYLGTK